MHLGTDIDCPLCDRAELPAGLRTARTAGPSDQDTIPEGLRRDHSVAAGQWGCRRVIEGTVGFVRGSEVRLTAGDRQPIPPGVPHHLAVDGPVVVAVDFLVSEVDEP